MPYGCTAPAAYKEPIRNMTPDKSTPPVIAEVLRPHLSASKKAGTEIANIKIADSPEARKDAVCEDNPA